MFIGEDGASEMQAETGLPERWKATNTTRTCQGEGTAHWEPEAWFLLRI